MAYTWALPFQSLDFIGAKTAHTHTSMQSRKKGPTSSANPVFPKQLSDSKDPFCWVQGAVLPTEGRMRAGPTKTAGFLDVSKMVNKNMEVA